MTPLWRAGAKCVARARAFLAQHLAEGESPAAARDKPIPAARALDAVHLADLSASRPHTHGCMVWTGTVRVRLLTQASLVSRRLNNEIRKEHANGFGRKNSDLHRVHRRRTG